MKPWTPCVLTDQKNIPLAVGDVMRYNPECRHIVNLRDYYLAEGQPTQRAMKKQWYEAALARRFIILEIGDNGYGPGLRYSSVSNSVEGQCVAGFLVRA